VVLLGISSGLAAKLGLVPANDESRDEEAGGLGLVAAAKEQR
jgi:hypothetical protein